MCKVIEDMRKEERLEELTEEALHLNEIHSKLAQAEEQIRRRETVDAHSALRDLRKSMKYRKQI